MMITSILLCLAFTGLFIAGKFTVFKREDDVKILPIYVVSMGLIFTLYIVSLVYSIVLLFIYHYNIFGTIFILFMLLPFIIGYFSNYKNLNIFLNLQIIELLISLTVSVLIVQYVL